VGRLPVPVPRFVATLLADDDFDADFEDHRDHVDHADVAAAADVGAGASRSPDSGKNGRLGRSFGSSSIIDGLWPEWVSVEDLFT